MFPNPASDIIKIAMPFENADVVISNVNGQKVIAILGYRSGDAMNITDLPTGIYTVVLNEGPTSKYFKLLKR